MLLKILLNINRHNENICIGWLDWLVVVLFRCITKRFGCICEVWISVPKCGECVLALLFLCLWPFPVRWFVRPSRRECRFSSRKENHLQAYCLNSFLKQKLLLRNKTESVSCRFELCCTFLLVFSTPHTWRCGLCARLTRSLAGWPPA